MDTQETYTAFVKSEILVAGPLRKVLPPVKEYLDRNEDGRVVVFDDRTGRLADFSLEGTIEQILDRVAPKQAGPGRPKLGVVCREISLLPRHWEWLEQQPNGASAALRRLVDEARKRDPDKERLRLAIEAVHRFMTTMAGNRPGFEEAIRALFAKDFAKLEQRMRTWPEDIRDYVMNKIRSAQMPSPDQIATSHADETP